MDIATYDCLENLQRSSLTTLHISRYSDGSEDPDSACLDGLTSLCLNAIDGSVYPWWIGEILRDTSKTLKHLCLGAESSALEVYNKPNEGLQLRQHIDNTLEEMVERVVGNTFDANFEDAPLLALNTLELKGLNAGKLIRSGFTFQLWSCLRSLTLESCYNVEPALSFLATKKEHDSEGRSELRLHSFHIRHHEPSSQLFIATLQKVLTSFTGLINLSILLENVDGALDLQVVLASHQKTLRTLVFEERRGRRDNLAGPATSQLPSIEQLGMIAGCCPDLVELGVLVRWDKLLHSRPYPSTVRSTLQVPIGRLRC